MLYDYGHELYDMANDRILYLLLSGMSYAEIANLHYYRRKYKVIYEVRKLFKRFKVNNRRHLVYMAITKNLVSKELLEDVYGI